MLQQQRLEGNHHKKQVEKIKRILDNTYIGKRYLTSDFNDVSVYFQSQSISNTNGLRTALREQNNNL